MSNVYELSRPVDPVDEASNWLAMLDRGLTEQEHAALREWLKSDPRNLETLLEIAGIWDRMDSLAQLAEMFPQAVYRQSRAPQFALAGAASMLLAVLVGFWIVSNLHSTGVMQAQVTDPKSEQIFQTVGNKQSTAILSDGSQLILNADSLARVIFTDRQRRLVLESGEMYIDVARDASRPLIVHAGGKVMEAVGTAFNVKFTPDQRIELIVTEGRVLVDAGGGNATISGNSAAPSTAVPALVAVSAGEQLLLGDADEEVMQIEPEQIQAKLSWRELNFVFHGESLADVLAKIERYTSVEFVLVEEELKRLRVVGMFKADDVDGLLATLRENFGISHEYLNKEKIILTRK